ncbi:hypothetical protein CKY51_07900 [Xanthomonas maliensis]|nr:hypothetical protein CKY51_07900 [Xanthomonas maliensis]
MDARRKQLASDAAQLQAALNALVALRPTSEQALRAAAHARIEQTYRDGRASFDHAGGLLQRVLAYARSWPRLQAAKRAYRAACAQLETAAAFAQRQAEAEAHNRHLQEQQHASADLRERHAHVETLLRQCDSLLQQLAPAATAALQDGWKAPDFANHFHQLATDALADRFTQALAGLQRLQFQVRPSAAAYDEMQRRAEALRKSLHERQFGLAATAAYPALVNASTALAAPMLQAPVAARLAALSQPSERWHALSLAMCDPRSARLDALWALYWPLVECGQDIADEARSDPHEDPLNGAMRAQLRHAAEKIRKRLPTFGYPQRASYIGSLMLANKQEETQTGADIGLVIALDIGDLCCRKVALVQAKKAVGGIADVGSKQGQLEKLIATPRLGYYLFYHRLAGLFAPSPSVCRAHDIAAMVSDAGKKLSVTSLPLDVLQKGWDWSAFLAFGLCNPAAPIGVNYDTLEDALATLDSGGGGKLPRYLQVIAISDAASVQSLEQSLQQRGYQDVAQQPVHARSPKPRQPPTPGR